MKTLRILVVVLLVPFTMAFADNGNNTNANKNEAHATVALSGMVLDKVTGEVLTGVKVEIAGTNSFTYTDFEGNFRFDGLAPGQYNVKTSFISYEERIETVQLDTENKLEIQLEIVD